MSRFEATESAYRSISTNMSSTSAFGQPPLLKRPSSISDSSQPGTPHSENSEERSPKRRRQISPIVLAQEDIFEQEESVSSLLPPRPQSADSSSGTGRKSITFNSCTRADTYSPLLRPRSNFGVLPGLPRLQLKGERDRTHLTSVVVGGSITGLAVAKTLADLGISVVVAELRDGYYRPAHVNLRQHAVDELARLAPEIMDVLGQIHEAHFVNEIEKTDDVRRPGLVPPRAESPSLSPLEMLKTPSVAQAVLSDLEGSLLDAAKKAGVIFADNADVSLNKAPGTKRFHATLREVSRAEGGVTSPSGRELDLGFPDLVVIADGAGGTTRAQVGIELIQQSAPQRFVAGLIDKRSGGMWRLLTTVAPETGEVVRHIFLGHEAQDRTWAVVELPNTDVGDLSRYFRTQVMALTGWSADDIKIVWGGDRSFPVFHARPTAVTAGYNVFLAGDSSGHGSFLAGAGVNRALVCDVASVKTAAEELQRGGKRRDVLRAYTERSQESLDAWFKMGEHTIKKVDK